MPNEIIFRGRLTFIVSSVLFLSILGNVFSFNDLVWGRSLEKSHSRRTNHNNPTVGYASKKDKGGYQFGDITKNLVNKVTDKVNKATGNEKYEFGDLSRYLDQQSKGKINALTEKEDYEFGDLSRWIDSRIKDEAVKFTGKDKDGKEYQFGDVSKEIVKRVTEKDYDISEILTLCKILLSFGAGLNPISGFLPVKLLIDLLNASILSEMGEKLIGAISLELDKRFKKFLTGDPEYQMGDLAKKSILKFIGKEDGTYEFGDISRTVLSSIDDNRSQEDSKPVSPISLLGTIVDVESSPVEVEGKSLISLPKIDPQLVDELEKIDTASDLYLGGEKSTTT